MNSQWNIARQRDYRGGEVQSLLPETVGRNQLLKMENALIFPNGYVTAFHQTDIESMTGADHGVCLSLNADGTYTFFANPATENVTKGILDTALDTPVNVSSGTPVYLPCDIRGIGHTVNFLTHQYYQNYPDGIIDLTDNTTYATGGKSIRKLKVYVNRLWGVCTDGTLIISDNGDATTWNALNIIYLPNKEKIIDFIPVSGGAIVYSATSAYAMYGSDYRDISFVLLLDGQRFSSGAVNIDNTVFIVGTRGVYQVSLNGATEIPHMQSEYFKSLFGTFSAEPYLAEVVQGVHLQRFEAILFMWSSAFGGSQGFVYYPFTKAYSKVNQLLNPDNPFILAMNDSSTDFLIGGNTGIFFKSTYPSSKTFLPRQSIIKTRHEDADSLRYKVWRELSVNVGEVVYGVTIDAFLDESTTPVNIVTGTALAPGANLFFLNLSRSRSISFQFTINNITVLYITDDFGNYLTDDFGNRLYIDSSPGNYTLKELRMKYREAGPAT